MFAAKFSLKQLFLGVTLWSICFGMVTTELPNWAYAFIAIAAPAAALFLLVRCKSGIAAGFLSLPLICIANFSAFLIALGYVSEGSDFVSDLLGPIAWVASWPVVFVQNSVPLPHIWDTALGIAVVSLAETSALFGVVSFGLRYTKPKGQNPPA